MSQIRDDVGPSDHEDRKLAARRTSQNSDLSMLAVPQRLKTEAIKPGDPVSSVPILQCYDLDKTVAFYEAFGFTSIRMSGYVVFVAGGAEVHVSRVLEPVAGGCLIHVADVAQFRNSIADDMHSATGPVEQQGEQGSGVSMFTVVDPDGNVIRFAGPLP